MSSCPQIYGHHARQLGENEIEKLVKDTVTVNEYVQSKLENEAKKNWDKFYKRNKKNFFKDRHWTKREFEELANFTMDCRRKPILLEVGCGVGNFIFPLIADGTDFFIHACDFSERAVEFVKESDMFSTEACNAFVCDVTKDDLSSHIRGESVDIATMIFVLSSIHPDKMRYVVENIYKVLRPGGMLLLRDYGLFDQAMLRFGPGHKLGHNFYFRQDGTRAFYFSEEYLENLMVKAGFEVKANHYVSRETINHKEGICVPRIYIQSKFIKPELST